MFLSTPHDKFTTSQFDARINRINPYKLLMLLYRPESSTPLTFPRAMRLAQQYQQTVMPYQAMPIAIAMPNAEARSDANPKQPHKLGQRPASSVQEKNKTSIESKQKVHPRSLLQTPHCMPITHTPLSICRQLPNTGYAKGLFYTLAPTREGGEASPTTAHEF